MNQEQYKLCFFSSTNTRQISEYTDKRCGLLQGDESWGTECKNARLLWIFKPCTIICLFILIIFFTHVQLAHFLKPTYNGHTIIFLFKQQQSPHMSKYSENCLELPLHKPEVSFVCVLFSAFCVFLNVRSSFIHNSRKGERTQMSMNSGMDE